MPKLKLDYQREHGLINIGDVVRKSTHGLSDLEYPFNSVVHIAPIDDLTMGVSASHPAIPKGQDLNLYADFEMALKTVKGRPIQQRRNFESEIKDWFRKNRQFRMVRDEERTISQRSNLLVVNYGVLPMRYYYQAATYSQYNKWQNVINTVARRIESMTNTHEKSEQFLVLTLTDRLPTIAELRKAEESVPSDLLPIFESPTSQWLLEMFRWLGDGSRNSLLRGWSEADLARVNVLLMHNDKWIFSNLSVFWNSRNSTIDDLDDGLEEIKNGLSTKEVQNRLLRWFMGLYGEVDDSVFDAPEESEEVSTQEEPETLSNEEAVDIGNEEIGEDFLDDDDDELSTNRRGRRARTDSDHLMSSAHTMLESGQITQREYSSIEERVNNVINLPNPFGEGTIEDALKIDEEAIPIAPKEYVKGNDVLDEDMLKSSLDTYNQKYIEQVFKQDMLRNILASQRADFIISNIDIDEIEDLNNEYYSIKIRGRTIGGAESTIPLKIHKPRADGTFLANGVRYRLRPQPIDLPIRKVSPSKVTLTSVGYGKSAVQRSEFVSVNYDAWIARKLMAIAIDDTNSLLDSASSGNVFNNDVSLPRDYTAVAKSISSLKSKKYEFTFDYSKVKDLKVKDGHVPISKEGRYTMDFKGMVYDGGEELGTLIEIFQLGDPPREYAEYMLLGKKIPVAVLLGARMGFSELLKEMNVTSRKVSPGGRMNLGHHEFALRFQDVTLVVDGSDPKVSMMLSGLNQYHKYLKMYRLIDYDRPEAFHQLMEAYGLGPRYGREIDLFFDMFIDPITETQLIRQKEPTDMIDLLFRAVELLETDQHKHEVSSREQRLRGYEKFNSFIYKEIVSATRIRNAKGRTRNSRLEVHPYSVSNMITDDPAVILVQESNPLHELREGEMVTASGTDGRSALTMVGDTRSFQADDVGIYSESGKDDGGVGVNTFLSVNANIVDVYGNTKQLDEEDSNNAGKYFSSSALNAPRVLHEDQQSE